MFRLRRIKAALAVAGAAVLCSGCGTIVARSGALAAGSWGSGSVPPVYPATCLDVAVTLGPSSAPIGKQAAQRLVFFIDLPFSVATDTLCLPFDLLPESRSGGPEHQPIGKGAEQLQPAR